MLSTEMKPVDFGRVSEDYAAYRPGLPSSFYDRLERIRRIRGSRSLDLATGTGTVALELATRGSSVVGIDISAGQVEAAERLSRERRLEDRVTFKVADAASTGLTDDSFDLVTASQCWHWFDRDAVMNEIRRLLRPGGVLAVIHHAYVTGHSPLTRDTESLILEFNPSWPMAGGNGTFPDEIDDVIRGGFRFVEQFSYDDEVTFTHDAWVGRIRTCNGVGPSLSPTEVRRFDERLAELLREKYPDPVGVPHRVWCVVASNG